MIDTFPALLLTLLVIPGIALLASIYLLFGAGAGSPGTMRTQLSILGWLCVWLALVGVVVGLGGGTPLILLLLFGVLVVGLMAWVQIRRAEHRSLLSAIAAGARRGIPPGEMARAFGGEASTGTKTRAMTVAHLVDGGMPLDAAVARAPLWLGTGLHVAVRTGTALGALEPAVVNELSSGREMDDVLRPIAPRLWYFVVVLNLATGIVIFVMLKIVPVFDRMFQEFELPLPMPTILLIEAARFTIDYGLLLVLPYALIPLLLLAVTLLYVGIFPRNLPLLDRMFRRYDGAIVLRNLALAVERGLAMPKALALIGNVYPLGSVGRALLAAAEHTSGGADWCQALLRSRLIGRTDVAVLAAAERAGNLPWAMQEVADNLVRREAYRWQWWLNVLGPLVMVLFGLSVAMIVIPLFIPLIALIEGLSR